MSIDDAVREIRVLRDDFDAGEYGVATTHMRADDVLLQYLISADAVKVVAAYRALAVHLKGFGYDLP